MSKQTKENLFNHARQAFSEFGYKNTSLDQIAKMAKIGKSTIYHYVNSKRELFKEIVDQEINNLEKIAQQFLSSNINTDSIIDYLYYSKENQTDSTLIAKIINESKQIGTTEAFEELSRLEDKTYELMEKLLNQLLNNDHKFSKEQVKLRAFLVVENFNLLERKWPEKNPYLDKEVVRSKIKSILINI